MDITDFHEVQYKHSKGCYNWETITRLSSDMQSCFRRPSFWTCLKRGDLWSWRCSSAPNRGSVSCVFVPRTFAKACAQNLKQTGPFLWHVDDRGCALSWSPAHSWAPILMPARLPSGCSVRVQAQLEPRVQLSQRTWHHFVMWWEGKMKNISFAAFPWQLLALALLVQKGSWIILLFVLPANLLLTPRVVLSATAKTQQFNRLNCCTACFRLV